MARANRACAATNPRAPLAAHFSIYDRELRRECHTGAAPGVCRARVTGHWPVCARRAREG
eukprot:CAMPEP_0194783434 /NCGR_PEP_ID=MMETSP0323_2-20130528/79224_1 /TAXON_ID=2866 ORGANISM="Crypthecodinium cohnii, Strain Seligo" /NCGR_SAMPLE_ID=MMETSP0323_2 /ASSEMBLY_ACC=CAM_ASM_000346 /LENGTH=59 /DNA_ID=CAMNT_0039722321 /DNA_START=590 /DNA_END=769 /DNA_ORIENTATION=+